MVSLILGEIDACMEVCQHFGYYLPGSAIISQMTLSQRAVNILYALRDYSPVTTSLALLLLPIALYPTGSNDSTIASPEHQRHLSWLRNLFLVTYLSHKINIFIMYKHIGLSKLANFTSHEVWVAPCKSSYSISRYNRPPEQR